MHAIEEKLINAIDLFYHEIVIAFQPLRDILPDATQSLRAVACSASKSCKRNSRKLTIRAWLAAPSNYFFALFVAPDCFARRSCAMPRAR